MSVKFPLPIVGVPVDVKLDGGASHHAVGEKYVNALVHGAGCYPVLLPAMSKGAELRGFQDKLTVTDLAAGLDGVFLPGSHSNIAPDRYGGNHGQAVPPIDLQRDEMALKLIRACVDLAVPLLAVCRGFQEMNVAFGGSIHPEVHKMEVFLDHRENYELPRDQHYRHAHAVELADGGRLHSIYGATRAMVNSLHGQGIDRLGQGLQVEATAPDGLVEAIHVEGSEEFALGVQWHPEWRFWEDDFSKKIFGAFHESVMRRRATRERSGSDSKPIIASQA